jgi:hypothetical protein
MKHYRYKLNDLFDNIFPEAVEHTLAEASWDDVDVDISIDHLSRFILNNIKLSDLLNS